MRQNAPPGRLVAADVLRGLAALGVVVFHFTRRSFSFGAPMPASLERYGWVGEHGVQVFFVLSGCVLPLALDRAGYRVAHFGRFLARRLVRIDLPYVASFTLPLLVTWATIGHPAPLMPGRPRAAPPASLAQVLLHLGYANGLAGVPSLNPVYWTLAIELQFYVLAGLTFALVASERARVRLGAVAALVLASALPLPSSVPVPGKTLILVHLPFFALGILAFQRRSGRAGPLPFAVSVAGVTAFLLARGAGGSAVAGLLATLVVATPWPAALTPPRGLATPGAALVDRALRHLGRISYSLYLVHLPVGMWTAWQLTQGAPARGLGAAAPVVAALVALVGSLVVAQLLYVLVERPALRLAQRIAHRPAERPSAAWSVRAHVGDAVPPVRA